MTSITLKLPDLLLKRLNRAVAVKRVTKSELIREALSKALDAEEAGGGNGSCYDLARDLAGKVKGLPKDLATNPAYMRDFGR